MSLSVVDNFDGTYTVTCGSETQIVGTPHEFAYPVGKTYTIPIVAPGREERPHSRFPKSVPRNPAGTAVRIVDPYTTIHMVAGTMDDFNAKLDSGIRPLVDGSTPTLLSMLWNGEGVPDTAHISRALQSLPGVAPVECHVHVAIKKDLS